MYWYFYPVVTTNPISNLKSNNDKSNAGTAVGIVVGILVVIIAIIIVIVVIVIVKRWHDRNRIAHQKFKDETDPPDGNNEKYSSVGPGIIALQNYDNPTYEVVD